MSDDTLLVFHDDHVEDGDVTDDDENDLDGIKELASEYASEDDTDCFLFPDADSEFFGPVSNELEHYLDDSLASGQDEFGLIHLFEEDQQLFDHYDDNHIPYNGVAVHVLDYYGGRSFRFPDADDSFFGIGQDEFGLIHLFEEDPQLFDHYDDNHIPYYDVAVPVLDFYGDGSSLCFPDADDSFFGIEPVELEIQVWVDRGRRYSLRASRLIQRAFQMISHAKSSGFQVVPDSELEDMESHAKRIMSYAYWVDEYYTKCKVYLRDLLHVRHRVRQPLRLVRQTLYEQLGGLMSLAGQLRVQINVENQHKINYAIWQQQCKDYMHHLLHPEEAAVEAGQVNAVEAGQVNAVEAGELQAVGAVGPANAVEAGQVNAVEAGELQAVGAVGPANAVEAGQVDAVETGEPEAVEAVELNAANAPADVGQAADE